MKLSPLYRLGLNTVAQAMSLPEYIGWLSSLVLLGTIWVQIRKQYKEGSSRGVSWGLFIGQAVASAGFVVYSLMLGDAVFITTNSILLLSHFFGIYITYRQKTRGSVT